MARSHLRALARRTEPSRALPQEAATRLGPARLCTVASPEYLDARGTPHELEQLAEHDCVSLVPDERTTGWPMQVNGRLRMVSVAARLRVNGVVMARNAARAGLGIAHLPEFVVASDLALGRLVRVLERHGPEVGGVHVVYPHSRLLAPKVTEFVGQAVEHFAGSVRPLDHVQ